MNDATDSVCPNCGDDGSWSKLTGVQHICFRVRVVIRYRGKEYEKTYWMAQVETFEVAEYIWTEENWSCDCNRLEEFPEIEAIYEDDGCCRNDIELVSIEAA